MVTQADPQDLAEARAQLARYLSDEIAPMIFAEAAEVLFSVAPEAMARGIHSWIGVQLQGPHPSPISDYLLHAARKVHHLGELELIPRQDLSDYLKRLAPMLVGICPEHDRAQLAEDLGRLDTTDNEALAAQISVSRGRSGGGGGGDPHASTGSFDPPQTGQPQQAGSGAYPDGRHQQHAPQQRPPEQIQPAPDLPPDQTEGEPPAAARQPAEGGAAADRTGAHIDRLNLLLDRWERVSSASGTASAARPRADLNASLAGAESALLTRIIDEVASSARSRTDLDNQLRYLSDLGVSASTSGVFKTLSGTLPDWAPAEAPSAEIDEPERLSGAAETMRKVVDLAKDPAELTERFKELVETGVEQFNEGSLGRAVTVLDLAQRMMTKKEVDASLAANLLDQASSKLDEAKLKRFTDDDDKRLLLRRVLRFFPTTQVDNLMQDLIVEDRRDRRRLILRLLMVHGEEARGRVIKMLDDSLSGNVPQPWYVQRNLIYLMRSIPPSEAFDIDKEIDLLVRASVPGGELPLIREALTALGQIDNPRSVKTLTARLSDLEDVLLQKGKAAHDADEIQPLLDAAVKALIHFDTKEARQCVVTHGLKRRPELGDTFARLAMLGSLDLKDDPTTVARIIEAIKEELPVKVFGVSVKTSKKAQNLERLIDSLSGTDIPKVRKVYDGIVKNFPGERFANAAAKALTRLGSKRQQDDQVADSDEVTSLSGDLSLFGLPNLMQNIADSRLEGVLTVLDEAGNATATISLCDGMLIDAEVGDLTGDIAVYQLLERPITGRFIFVNQPVLDDEQRQAPPGIAVMSLLMEGMRRYDEFNRAATVIPDDATFVATGVQPTGLPDEDDADFVNGIWIQAAKGATPIEIERGAKVDGYRIFRLFEHWVHQGALTPKQSEA